MYSECVNMCVTLYLCMCIFLWLWLLVCVRMRREGGHAYVCLFVGAMTATWTSELFIMFLWRHHREPEIRLFIPMRHHALLHPICILTWCGLWKIICTVRIHHECFFSSTFHVGTSRQTFHNRTNLRHDSICSVSHGASLPFCIYAAISSAVRTGEISVSIAANKSWIKYSANPPEKQHHSKDWMLNQSLSVNVKQTTVAQEVEQVDQ